MPVTDAQIESLYRATLAPRLAALDEVRRTLKRTIVKSGLLVGVPLALFMFSGLIEMALGLSAMQERVLSIGAFMGIFVGVIVAGTKYLMPGVAAQANYTTRFKREVASEVFRMVCPTATYAPDDGIAAGDFDAAGLFNTRGTYRSDDHVHGTIGQTAFEAAEVRRAYSTGSKNSRTRVVFHGLFFRLDFRRRLRGTTLVQPEGAADYQIGNRDGLTRVTIEHPEFAADYVVYSTDEQEARALITPSMVDDILALEDRAGHALYLAFTDRRAYLAVHHGKPLFEPSVASTTSLPAIQAMARQFALAEAIVQQLEIDTRQGAEPVDATFTQPRQREDGEDDEDDDALDEVMSSGNVTASQVWEAAAKAMNKEPDGPAAPVAMPAGTTIVVERGAGTFSVTYGTSLGAVIALLVWAVSVPIWFAAARLMPEAVGQPDFARFTSWIPAIPYASDVVASHPIPWFAATWIVGPIAYSMWSTRVRKVEIGSDAVRIWRGLRPLPRRYPRPEYGKVVRLERFVYIGKTEGLHVINPSASPALTDEEARWVAQELRRALEQSPVLR